MNQKELQIKKVEYVIQELVFARSYKKNMAATHFSTLRKHLIEGKKLTKKMKENLEWIEKNVQLL